MTSKLMSAAVIPLVIEQHAEEAAFLWILRDVAAEAPHYRLKDLAKLEGRIEAHLDGLRIAGEAGWRLCEKALGVGEAGEAFAAGVLALESRDQRHLGKVFEAVEHSPEAVRGLVSAFGWVEPSRLSGTVKTLLGSSSWLYRCVGIRACAMHRVDPGPVLNQAIRDGDIPAEVGAAALRAAGELRRKDLLPAIRERFESPDETIRFWSAWAAFWLGDRGTALEILRATTVSDSRFRTRALALLLRAVPLKDAQGWLKGMMQYPQWQYELVMGVGMMGDPAYLPWLMQQMERPALARAAGEAFSLITGVDIAYEDLEGERPQGFEAGPTEDPKDENVRMDRDENLPWPDHAKMRAWWEAHRERFSPGHRYLAGAPVSPEQCREVLREGYQRQRAAAALELGLMQADTPLFEVRAPAWRQRRWLQSTP